MDHVKAVNQVFGSACVYPWTFQGELHAFLTSSSFEEGIRKTIKAGGDNCGHLLFFGVIYEIPAKWIESTKNAEVTVENSIKAF